MKCPECETQMRLIGELPKKGEVGVDDWEYESMFECSKCRSVWLYHGGIKKLAERR